MRSLFLAVPLLLAACVSVPRLEPATAEAPAFSIARFFGGKSEGRGRLKVALGGARAIHVRSSGRVEPGGAVVLDQIIEEEGRPARTRTWRLREVAPGRYQGTLSDAAGPVTGTAAGNRLHLKFRMRGGLDADQWLTLAADGRSAHNLLVVRKFGLTVAAFDETIRKLD